MEVFLSFLFLQKKSVFSFSFKCVNYIGFSGLFYHSFFFEFVIVSLVDRGGEQGDGKTKTEE